MKRIVIGIVGLASVGLLAGLWAGPVPGSIEIHTGDETDMPPKGPKIAGTWYSVVSVFDPSGVPIPGADINTLATYHFKGGVTVDDTTDEGGHALFIGFDSSAHGAWNVDGNEVTTVTIAFAFDETGVHTGAARVTTLTTYDPMNPDEAMGVWFVELFDANEDPLGPPRPAAGGGGIFSRRLVVGN